MKNIYTTKEDIKKLREEMKEDEKGKVQYFKKYVGKTKNILFGLIIVALVGILLMVNAVKSEGKVPSFMGFSLYQVETGSMEPTLPVGSIILTKSVAEKDKLLEGDIVTFRWDEHIVTHRIIEVMDVNGEVRYKTKGDNPNNSIDPELLHPDNIIAKFVFKIPLIG